MTVWDEIYKNHNNGGEVWATLDEEVMPQFTQFIENGVFPIHVAFDIGCGTGKYLAYLTHKGFKVGGIDSSPTAIEMTSEVLEQDADIFCTDMFAFDIPKESKDLITSISTIHHGTKENIERLIGTIYDALVVGGRIFITLPDFQMAKDRNRFENHDTIAPMTFAPIDGPEKGLPHSFYLKSEIEALFSKFKNVEITIDEIGRWIIVWEKTT